MVETWTQFQECNQGEHTIDSAAEGETMGTCWIVTVSQNGKDDADFKSMLTVSGLMFLYVALL